MGFGMKKPTIHKLIACCTMTEENKNVCSNYFPARNKTHCMMSSVDLGKNRLYEKS